MNIIDAIKSGWAFKRPSWDSWFKYRNGANVFDVTPIEKSETSGRCHAYMNLAPDDIHADDWEIQEPTVTITRTQFLEAWKEGIGIGNSQRDWMARKLGLETP